MRPPCFPAPAAKPAGSACRRKERPQNSSKRPAARPTASSAGDAARLGRDLTARRLILETLEEVLPKLKKIVLDERTQKQIDLGVIED